MWMILSVLAYILALLLALVTASVAEGKGHNGLPWFFVGLVAPVVGLLIALVLLEERGSGSTALPTAPEAARASPVARLLASTPGLSVHAVTEATGLTDREVLDQLAALRSLGYAERDEQGKWHLTGDGATAVNP